MGIAKAAVSLLMEYLTEGCAISAINAYVVPKNIFRKSPCFKRVYKNDGNGRAKNWGKEASVFTDRYVYIRRKKGPLHTGQGAGLFYKEKREKM